MSVSNLADRRERSRVVAESVFAEVEREVVAARDAIMSSALRRLARADAQATLDPTVERLGRIWSQAWPFAKEGAR